VGTVAFVNSTVKLSFAWNAFYYWGVWAVCIIGLGVVLWAALKSPRWARWTTQDILIVAALGVLLEVYDNIIGDQFIGPLINPVPGADLLQLQDIVYMFLLMVGVALVRKPGCVTAMVFINFLLMQLLFGSGHGALDWTDGLTQGIFCDLYIVARRGKVYAPGSRVWVMFIDGLMIGGLRGGPNSFLTDWTFDPYLNSIYYTWYQMWTDTWSNWVGNAVEAAITSSLALRVARSVVPSIGGRRSAEARDIDPFAEDTPPEGEPAAMPATAADSLPAEGEPA
jgi:ABC-type cobalt transport system, permease component